LAARLATAEAQLFARHFGQKSINDGHGRTSVPRNYWTVVLGSLLQIAMWIAASTRVLPTFKHVSFRADEASALNTVPAILLCMLIAEFGFYWSHRLFHCRLLYRHFHCLHHRIAAPVSAYDALYQDPVELELNLLLTYLPLAFVPIHIGAIACYLYFSGFVAFVLNHSGREYELTIPIPFTEPACQYVVWSTKLHDDHHHFAKGNFGAQLWCFDEIFGTRIRASKPKTRTKRRWDALAHAAQAVALWKATTAGV
jgi:sterol desaturase/sphingolipid hydroxylase (fatty acid hydroxylase superfamily)